MINFDKGVLMKDTVLLIGDNNKYINFVESELANADFDVIISSSLSAIEALMKEEEIKLIIAEEKSLDNILYLRESGYNQPMVAIYKYYNEDFILDALDNGVDDCISILCSRKLFLAKIKNIIKRFYKNFDVIRYKDITFTSNNNNFYLKGTSLELTKLEKQLLLEFLKNANKILSRDSLLENVWSENFNIQLRTVNVAVKRLRDKINLYMGDDYIKSVRGQGYLFS